jgi:hypothetical protein
MIKIESLKNNQLESILDALFSVYIRLRDSDDNGFTRCISCGKTYHWSEIQNGHYVSRSNKRLRFNETNCNAQCVHCNVFLKGNYTNYVQGLENKYGLEARHELDKIEKFAIFKPSKFYYLDLIIRYYDLIMINQQGEIWFNQSPYKSKVIRIVEKYRKIIN